MKQIAQGNPSPAMEVDAEKGNGSFHRQILATAMDAIKLADTHATPPVPKTYTVWYAYAEGENELINKRISALIKDGRRIDSALIDEIHNEFFSLDLGDGKKHSEANSKLNYQMDEVIGLVESYMESTDGFSTSLDASLDKLSKDTKPVQLMKIIKHLVAKKEKMQKETLELALQLEQSKNEIEEIRASLQEATENSLRDPLTNARNRRYFDLALESEIACAHDNDTSLCLAMADLDYFKRVNDLFGHSIGDEVLKYFAALLKSNLKGSDVIARYGGEEFAVILPRTTLEDARALFEKIRKKLQASRLVMSSNQQAIGQITASFGIAEMSKGDDPAKLLVRADTVLYQAKEAGRNRVFLASED